MSASSKPTKWRPNFRGIAISSHEIVNSLQLDEMEAKTMDNIVSYLSATKQLPSHTFAKN